eukprot:Plantae.Rhodophyta-Palmaria_palmata.ctg6052.p1 GENE.Plantae.Rhodophyta-Palmaria_palmata.ctg6052~~Plantae.Rhodophyta-Palmaria_palmata.ctg6052.p1  ORF type:complete len:134 (+),score=12.53 Plantae.Rhodophyta-Palmaria_palmata.ctg6052:291-692(+)
MIDHISVMKMHFGQLERIGVPKDEILQLSIFLDSVEVHSDYKQVVETLRVGSEDLQNWKKISKRLISTYAFNQRVKKNSKDSDNWHLKSARANVAGAKRGRIAGSAISAKWLGILTVTVLKTPTINHTERAEI